MVRLNTFVWSSWVILTASPGVPLSPGSPLAPHSPLLPLGPCLPGLPLTPCRNHSCLSHTCADTLEFLRSQSYRRPSWSRIVKPRSSVVSLQKYKRTVSSRPRRRSRCSCCDRTFGPRGPGSPLDPASPGFPTVPCNHRFRRASQMSHKQTLKCECFTLDGLDLKSNTHLFPGSLLLLARPLDLEAPGLPADRQYQRNDVSHTHTGRQQIKRTDVNLAEH